MRAADDAPHPSMKKEIVINASKDRARIAIVEDGQLAELYVEHPDNVRTLGNIYLGKVAKVMPQIHAAFVDIGQRQDAFLHFSDLTENAAQLFAMAGEKIPGLEAGPILATAPQKRVADDEDEPDVDETLEVEDAPDQSATARTGRSRSRRRRRGGRGRGRSRQNNRPEEEEEEERRLPHVIDLTQKTGSVRPTRRKEAPAADDASSDDTPSSSDTASGDAAPKRGRTRTPKSADTTSEDASGDSAARDEAPKPKRGRTRTPKSADTTEAPDADGASAEAPEASGDAAASEDKPKRSRSRSRSRKKTTDATPETTDAVTSDEATGDDVQEKPKRSRSRSKKKADAPDAEAPDAETQEADAPEADATEEKPKRSRSRSRSKKSTDDAPASDAEPTAAKADDETPEASGDDEEAKTHFDKHTIDLSTPSRPRGRRRTPPSADAEPEAAGDDATGDDADSASESESRSRRRSGRSRGGRSDADTTDSDDDTSEGGRSRRRGRRSDSDASSESTPSDKASDDSDETDADSGRSRRSRSRNRSDDSASDDRKSSSRKKDEQDDDSSSDDSRGSRSRGGRSRSDSDDDRKSSDRGSRGGRDSSRSSSGRSSTNGNGRTGQSNGKVPTRAEDLLKRGSRVLVKITKEPISSKGSRVSTDISLAGRFLVLVPAADYVAVSKKIESSKERRRLRALATSLKPANCGVIVRTVAGGQDAKALDQDLRLLISKWNKIEEKLDSGKAEPPILLHEDLDMVSSILRDLFTADFDRILVDDPKLHRKLYNYVKAVAPDMAERVVLHRSNTPIYTHVGIEKQVTEAFSERVNMKSGGYLIIEHTEAMHVVDVNSGRAGRGKRRAEENLLAVNMESAKEIARQLRLRDLGGIICIDFIDLRHERDRRKVTEVLKQEFKKDRAVTKVIGMSDFGVAQITRQRLRPSITTQGDDDADAMEAAGATAIPQPERDHPEPEATADHESEPSDDRSRSRRGRTSGDRTRDDRSRGGRRDSRRVERGAPSESLSPSELSDRVRDWLAHYRDTVDARYAKRPIVVSVHPLLGSYLRRGFPSPLTRLRFRLRNVPFRVVEDQNVDPLSFQVNDEKSGRSLLSKYTLEG